MKQLALISIVLGTALTAAAQRPGADEPKGYHLIHNFTETLPGSAILRARADTKEKKVGAAANRLEYQFSTNGLANTTVQFAPGRYRTKSGGTLKLWVKGDDSGNRQRFISIIPP